MFRTSEYPFPGYVSSYRPRVCGLHRAGPNFADYSSSPFGGRDCQLTKRCVAAIGCHSQHRQTWQSLIWHNRGRFLLEELAMDAYSVDLRVPVLADVDARMLMWRPLGSTGSARGPKASA